MSDTGDAGEPGDRVDPYEEHALLVPSGRRDDRWSLELEPAVLEAVAEPLTGWLSDPDGPRLELDDGAATYDHDALRTVAEDALASIHELIARSRRRRRLGMRDLVPLAGAAQNLTVIATLARDRGAPVDHLIRLGERLTIEALVALDHRFSPRPDGTIATRWTAVDRMVLEQLVTEVEGLLTSDSPDIVRLFPPAYADDAERNAGYAALAREELVSKRRTSLETLRRALDRDEATAEQMAQMMTAVNDLRLVLGTRLDVSEDDRGPRRADHPDAPAWAMYQHLTHLLGQIIEAQRTL
ncbi:MAG TPA: DUF2017 family protein [Microthrixaceae bacterium]|nr:DUF2017 family protein [Microthrixaceae bacterium]